MNRTFKFSDYAEQSTEEALRLLREERFAKKLVLKDVGEKFQASESTILRIEKNKYQFTFKMFLDMCELYDLDPVKVLEAAIKKRASTK